AFQHADSHGLEEIIAGGLIVIEVVPGAAGHGREVLDLSIVGVDGSLRGKTARGGSESDSGNRRDLFLERVPETGYIRTVRISSYWKVDTQREQPLGAETGIDFAQFPEGANHQAGADQQHQRECEFARDQRRSKTIGCDRSSGARAGFKRVVQTSDGNLRE